MRADRSIDKLTHRLYGGGSAPPYSGILLLSVLVSEAVRNWRIMIMQDNSIKTTLKTGITFGSALAMVISYVNWHSVGWAVVHGLMGWLYVGYYIIKY